MVARSHVAKNTRRYSEMEDSWEYTYPELIVPDTLQEFALRSRGWVSG